MPATAKLTLVIRHLARMILMWLLKPFIRLALENCILWLQKYVERNALV